MKLSATLLFLFCVLPAHAASPSEKMVCDVNDLNGVAQRRHLAAQRKASGLGGTPLTLQELLEAGRGLDSREREALHATINKRATGLTEDLDGELTRLQGEAKTRGLSAEKSADKSTSDLKLAGASKDGELTRSQKHFLETWGNRYRSGFGPLLTPPRGKIDPVVVAARKKMEDVIHKLAGDRLAKNDFHLVVNIYDATAPNAHMANEVGIVKKFPFSGHSLLGYAKDGKPIYELAATTSLLKMVENEDELGFVLGHEMSHLFQHHVDTPTTPMDDEAAMKQWWSGQQKEAVADHEGIKLMIGKYDLSASKTMLEKLAKLDKSTDDFEEFESGLSSHHQAGVRIALGEAAVEYFRKTDPLAAPRALTALPEDFGPHAHPRVAYQSDKFEENYPIWKNYLKNHLLKDETLEFSPVGTGKNGAEPHISKFTNARAGEAQIKKAFLESVNTIEHSRAPKQAKVDALLHSLVFLDTSVWGGGIGADRKPLWDLLTYAESDHVIRFIANQSVGSEKWTTEGFLNTVKENNILFPGYFAKNPRLQEDFSKLTKTVDSWKNFVTDVDRSTYLSKDGVILSRVDQLTEEVIPKKLSGGPMVEQMRKDILESLNAIKMKKGLSETNDPSIVRDFGDFVSRLKPENQWESPDDAFNKQLSDIVSPYVDEYRKASVRVFSKTADSKTVDDNSFRVLAILNQTAEYTPLKEEEKAALAPKMAKFSQGVAANGLDKEIIIPGTMNQGKDTVDAFSRALLDPKLKPAERNNVLETFLTLGATDFSKADDATKARFGEFLEKNMTKEELLKTLETESWSAIDKTLSWRVAEMKSAGSALRVFGDPDPARDVVDAYTLNRKRTLLDMVDNAPAYRDRVFKEVTFQEFGQVLDSFDQVVQKTMGKGTGRFELGASSIDFLMKNLFAKQDQAASFDEWKNAYLRIQEFAPSVLEYKNSYAKDIQTYLTTKWFPKMSENDVYAALKEPAIRKALDNDLVAGHLVGYVTKTSGDSASAADKAKILRQVDSDFRMIEELPELRETFKQKYLEQTVAQPRDLTTLFPDLNAGRTTTDLTQSAATPLRGMSFVASLVEKQPLPERMNFIEYILSRSDDMPKFVQDESDRIHKVKPDVPVLESIRNMRSQLRDATLNERVLFIDALMTGPKGMVETLGGTDFIVHHLMGSVDPANLKTAKVVADALLEAHADDKSLALAYMIAQKSQAGDKALSESDLIAAGLLAHGTPGVKFGQYLGFTSKFKKYSEALEKFQDDAEPLKYGEVLDLLNKRFDGKWPDNLEVKELMGFGSVHVAVGVVDKTTGKEEVVTVLRDNIQTATKEDFRRFNTFLTALAKADTGNGDFASFVGLSNLVEQSVGLEFDSEAAFQMQKRVFDRYDSTIGRVHIESVPAYSNQNGNLFMKKAEGITARKLLTKDPATYKEVMSVMSDAEMNILLGADKSGSPHPVPMHANPDFHDGQVVVDVKPNLIRAQILDFGQAVEISNAERTEALDILRVITKSESPEKAAQIINSMSVKAGGKNIFTADQMKKILDTGSDRMDVFIRLLSDANVNGYKIPISEIHWVLAVNRQIVLGEKIGIDNAAVFRNLIITRKLGLSEDVFLGARSATRAVKLTYEEAKRGISNVFAKVRDLTTRQPTSDITSAPQLAKPVLTDGFYRGANPAAKVGVYTANFDPPSAADLAAIAATRKQLGLDEVYVLVKDPARAATLQTERPTYFDFATRQSMAEEAFSHDPAIKVIDQSQYPGKSQAEIVESIAARNSGHTVTSIGEMGAIPLAREGDSVGSLKGKNIRYAVLGKPEDTDMLKSVMQTLAPRGTNAPGMVTMVEADVSAASASARRAIARGEVPEGLDEKVAAMIAAKESAITPDTPLRQDFGPKMVQGVPLYPARSMAELEKTKPAVAAALKFRASAEQELSTARQSYFAGKLSFRDLEKVQERFGDLESPVTGTSEAARRTGYLHQEENYLARRLAQARLDGDQNLAAQLKVKQAAVAAQMLGESQKRSAGLANGSAAKSARRGVIDSLEKSFHRYEETFPGKSFAQVAADPADLKLLQALNARDSLALGVADREARSRLIEVVQDTLVPAGDAKTRRSTAELMAQDIVNMHAAEKTPRSLPKERWADDLVKKCVDEGLCRPKFEAKPKMVADAEVPAAAQGVLAQQKLARSSSDIAAEAKAVAPSRITSSAALKDLRSNLAAEANALGERAAKAPALRPAQAETLRAISEVDSTLRTLENNASTITAARPLTSAEEKLNPAATSAVLKYLNNSDDQALSALNPAFAELTAKSSRSGPERLKEFQNITSALPKEEQAQVFGAVSQAVAKDTQAVKGGLKALDKPDTAAAAKAFTRADEVAAAAGDSEGKISRAVYRDAKLNPSQQALADAIGATKDKAVSKAEHDAAMAAATQKVEAEAKTLAKITDRAPAAIAKPGDFKAQAEEALKSASLDARQKTEIASALAKIAGKDSAKAASALAHLKGLASNPDMLETARLAYVHAAEDFAKSGDWNKSWESGVRKMLADSGYTPAEISKVVDKETGLKFYQQTARCLGISG